MSKYENEVISEEADDGTMPHNVDELRDAVIGHKIVSTELEHVTRKWPYSNDKSLIITLDNGTRVRLADTDDCCAFTSLEGFFAKPEMFDHAITGVITEDGYTRWHIYADLGGVLSLKVGWSCGNPFYYGYGFCITVEQP